MDEQISDSSVVTLGVTLLPEIPAKDNKDLWIFGESESKRRVITIERKNGSYGFTLQSYGVRYKHGHRETDFITYVNAVEKDGASYQAGLREGDVILSINGQNMARVEHKALVSFIRQSPASLKMVVVSDERARKVELHMRYVHLQKKLQDKLKELDDLNWKEKMILTGVYRQNSASGSPLGDLGLPSIGSISGQTGAEAASSVSLPPALGTSTTEPPAGNGTTVNEYANTRMNEGGTICCFCPQQLRLLNKQQNTSAEISGAENDNSNKSKSNTTNSKRHEKQAASQKETQTVQIVRISSNDKKSRSTSKAIKIFDKQTGNSCYEYYRKCQSSRELSNGNAGGNKTRSRNNSVTEAAATGNSGVSKENSTPTPTSLSFTSNHGNHSSRPQSHHRNAVSTNMIANTNSNTSTERTDTFGVGIGVKPKSWDNVMQGSTTKSFGGYGFGFGYGYYPSRENSVDDQPGRGLNSYGYGHHVTHPHHHNHHSHCTHAHSHGNYYYNVKGNDASSGNKKSHQESDGQSTNVSTYKGPQPALHSNHFYHKYNAIVNPYHYQGTITSTSTSIGIEATSAPAADEDTTSHHRSKTLPSLRRPNSNTRTAPDPFPTAKLEKTLSDSSLNSEHHKDFPKSMSYFKRSGDNVRFSSDEEFYGSYRRTTTPSEREHIFV